MKYFIDFEATQYTHEIISIGCVREDGATFESFVWVKRSHMSNFITRLTGITKDDVSKAPTSDEVFEKFYHWIENDNNFEFYCYGDNDIDFIRSNLKRTSNKYAIAALSIIGTNLTDYATYVKTYFGLHKPIALRRLVAYYRNVDKIDQSHNALEDSQFLKEVYDHVSTEEADSEAFPEYKIADIPAQNPSEETNPKIQAKIEKREKMIEEDRKTIGIIRYTTTKDEVRIDNIYTAIMMILQEQRLKGIERAKNKGAYWETRRILREAIENGTRAYHHYWKIDN